MTQKQQIMHYLRRHGEITIKEAIYQLGITQAATRIKELIEEDHQPITRDEWREVTKKNGAKTTVRVYRYCPQGQADIFGNQPTKHQGYGDPR